jgi:octaprenyl-diphosphate synthase
MDLAEIRELVRDDLEQVDVLIVERLRSDVALINQIGHHIIHSGGKRLRPLVVVLMARACGGGGRDAQLLAAIVELVHTATLLHDDVVDDSRLRRGRATANELWGNEASVLVGDFLYTRSFQMMVELERMNVMRVFATTTNTIAAGEVLQLLYTHDVTVSQTNYREVIYRKTAALFEGGCRLAAEGAGQGQAVCDAAAAFGRHLGTAFQLADDALDYDGDAESIGKNVGDDLAEGKPTLPLIRAYAVAGADERQTLERAISEGGENDAHAAAEIIANTDAITYTRRLAEGEADAARQALEALPPGELRDGLSALAGFAVARKH